MSTETLKQKIEKYLTLWVGFIYCTVSVVFYNCPFLAFLDTMSNQKTYNHLMGKNDMIVTFSTVMIGIYFTIYTLLLTKDILTKDLNFSINNIKSLISQLGVAFSINFIYVVFVIIGKGYSSFIFYTLINALILMLFFSTLQVGVLLIIIFKKRLKNYGELLKEEEIKEKEIKELHRKINYFIDESDKEKRMKYNDEKRKK